MAVKRAARVDAGPTKSSFIAIDTGLNEMGWAMWSGADADAVVHWPTPPTAAGVVALPIPPEMRARIDWTTRAKTMLSEFLASASGLSECKVHVMEMPEFRAGDAVGHAAAAGESLGMLYFMCGMHCRLADTLNAMPVFYKPREWKGQLSKQIVQARLESAIGDSDKRGRFITQHAWDAVGIGLHFAGHRIDDVRKFGGKKARQ